MPAASAPQKPSRLEHRPWHFSAVVCHRNFGSHSPPSSGLCAREGRLPESAHRCHPGQPDPPFSRLGRGDRIRRGQEVQGPPALLDQALGPFNWLRKVRVDAGFSGPDFAQHARSLQPNLEVEVVARDPKSKGFYVLARRWVVTVLRGGGFVRNAFSRGLRRSRSGDRGRQSGYG